MTDVLIRFEPVGDDDTLGAIKTVTKHVNDLKRISKTDLNMKSITDAISGADLRILQTVVDRADKASKAMRHLGIEYERTASKMKSPFDMGMADSSFINQFSMKDKTKSMVDFTHHGEEVVNTLNHMGIAYEKNAKKMQAPLMSPTKSGIDGLDFAQQFTAKAKGAPAFGPRTPESKASGNRMSAFSSAMMGMNPEGLPSIDAKVSDAARGAGDRMSGFAAAMNRADLKQGGKELREYSKGLEQVEARAKLTSMQMGLFSRIIIGMGIRAAVHNMLEFADSFTNLQNKIKTVVEGEGSVNYISDQLYQIANNSRTAAASIVTAFTRTSRAVSVLGKSQAETLQFTETLSKAIQVGGSTSVEASNAMIQLSQGMSSGALRGDELRSVLEQLPVVAQLIANKMGVTVGELRKLGAAGKLTTDVVFSAITDATETVSAKFDKMQLTLSQAFVKLGNAMTQWSSNLGGIMSKLASGVDYLATHFDGLVTVIESLAMAAIPLLVTRGFALLQSGWTALSLAFTANPLGLVITAVSMLALAFGPLISQMKVSEQGAATWGDVFTSTFTEVADKVKASLDTVFGIWDSIQEKFGDPKPPAAIEGWNESIIGVDKSTRRLVMSLATAVDLLTAIGPAAPLKAAAAFATGEKYMTMARDSVQRIMDDIDKKTEQASIDRAVKKNAEMQAKLDAEIPGTVTFKPDTKEKKKGDPGQTLVDQITKARRDEGDMMFGRDGSRNKDRSIDNRVFDQMLELQDKLKKTEFNKILNNPKLLEPLEQAIRAKETWKDVYRLIDETEKLAHDSMKKEWDDFAEQLKEILKLTEEAKKAVLDFKEAKADRESAKFDKMKGISQELDPRLSTVDKIKELEEYKKFAEENHLGNWAYRAELQINALKRTMAWDGSAFQTFADQMTSTFGPGGTLVKGFADTAANAIVAKQSLKEFKAALKDLLDQIAKQMLSAMFQLPLNMAMGAMFNPNGFMGGAKLPSFNPTGPGYGNAAAGAFANVGKLNGLPNQPGPVEISPYSGLNNTGVSPVLSPGSEIFRDENMGGFASGGYTGNYGVNEPAGIVHGREYVFNAQDTARIGKENLAMLASGRGMSGGSPKSASPVININNNAAGVDVQASVSPTTGEIEVMIDRKLSQRVDGAVAARLNDPNSKISRSMSQNVNANRRRT